MRQSFSYQAYVGNFSRLSGQNCVWNAFSRSPQKESDTLERESIKAEREAGGARKKNYNEVDGVVLM